MSSDHSEDDALSRVWVEAWQADVADPTRVRAAYQRSVASRRTVGAGSSASTPLLVTRWVLLGVVIGTSSLFAATRAADWLAQAPSVALARSSAPALLTPGQTSATATLTAVPPTPSAGEPGLVTPPDRSTSLRPVVTASEPELWQQAARGLRDKDFDAADAALAELTGEGKSSRDSARLVQAQVLLARGRSAEAKALLLELANTARSPRVQRKARELLSPSQENQRAHGSFSPDEETNPP
jgi:hypothetical protein